MAADEARQRKPYHSPRRAEQAIATRRAVLDAARETLWSAVAEEMLGGTVAEARTRGTDHHQAEQRHREHPGP